MADTRAAAGLTPQQWDDKFFTEYFQDFPYADWMGTGPMSIIQVKEDLTKKKGDRITFALLHKMNNDPVLDDGVLEGNEERLDSRSFPLRVRRRRNAFIVGDHEEQKSAIGLRDAGRDLLDDWATEDTRDLITDAACSIDGVSYVNATEAQKDAWTANNADRILFGKVKSNNSSNDHSASLLNVDSTNDKFTFAALKLMKRMAKKCSPKIRPMKDKGNNKLYYVVLVDPFVMRDLKSDSEVIEAMKLTASEEKNSTIWEGGDIILDGCIVKELDDMPIIAGAGNGGIDVGRAILMGAQAIGMGWAKRWSTKTGDRDWGDKAGVAIRATYGVEKLRFGTGDPTDTDDLINPKDNGIVTGYFACVADS